MRWYLLNLYFHDLKHQPVEPVYCPWILCIFMFLHYPRLDTSIQSDWMSNRLDNEPPNRWCKPPLELVHCKNSWWELGAFRTCNLLSRPQNKTVRIEHTHFHCTFCWVWQIFDHEVLYLLHVNIRMKPHLVKWPLVLFKHLWILNWMHQFKQPLWWYPLKWSQPLSVKCPQPFASILYFQHVKNMTLVFSHILVKWTPDVENTKSCAATALLQQRCIATLHVVTFLPPETVVFLIC